MDTGAATKKGIRKTGSDNLDWRGDPEDLGTLRGQSELCLNRGGMSISHRKYHDDLVEGEQITKIAGDLSWDRVLWQYITDQLKLHDQFSDRESTVWSTPKATAIRKLLTNPRCLCMIPRKWNSLQDLEGKTIPWYRKRLPDKVVEDFNAVYPGVVEFDGRTDIWYPHDLHDRQYNEERVVLELAINAIGFGYLVDPLRESIYRKHNVYFKGRSFPGVASVTVKNSLQRYGFADVDMGALLQDRDVAGALRADLLKKATVHPGSRDVVPSKEVKQGYITLRALEELVKEFINAHYEIE